MCLKTETFKLVQVTYNHGFNSISTALFFHPIRTCFILRYSHLSSRLLTGKSLNLCLMERLAHSGQHCHVTGIANWVCGFTFLICDNTPDDLDDECSSSLKRRGTK